MGFVGKFFQTLFAPEIPQASVMQPTVTARDLVQSTSSAEPQAPLMGASAKGKGGGTSSLLVPSEKLYKGRA